MQKFLFAVIVCASGFSPVFVLANEQVVLAKENTPVSPSYDGLNSGRFLAIGAGVIIGATIGYSALTFRGAAILGGVAGGLIGGGWYGRDAYEGIDSLPRRNEP